MRMCNLMGSCKNNYKLFGYDPNVNTPEWYKDHHDPSASMTFNVETTNEVDTYELMSPEPGKKYCAFCGFEMPIEDDICDECALKEARRKDFERLGYVPSYYNISPEKNVCSPSAQDIEYINMGEEEEEEDPEEEEEDPEEEEEDPEEEED